jgi:hypothetical protein
LCLDQTIFQRVRHLHGDVDAHDAGRAFDGVGGTHQALEISAAA